MRRFENKEIHRRSYPNWLDLLAIVGICMGAGFAAGLLISAVGHFVEVDRTVMLTIAYVFQFAVTIVFVILLQRNRGVKENFIKFNFRKFNPVLILWGIILVLLSGIVIEPLLSIFPAHYIELLNTTIGTGGWAILMTVVLAPILEEILFRGLILGSIREKSGAVRAVLISALIFGLIHIIPQQVVSAFVVGIILGYIYVKTGSLLNVVIIHALNNGAAYLLKELLGTEVTTVKDTIGNDTWFWVIYGVSVVLFGLAFYGIMRSLRNARRAEEAAAIENSAPNAERNNNNHT